MSHKFAQLPHRNHFDTTVLQWNLWQSLYALEKPSISSSCGWIVTETCRSHTVMGTIETVNTTHSVQSAAWPPCCEVTLLPTTRQLCPQTNTTTHNPHIMESAAALAETAFSALPTAQEGKSLLAVLKVASSRQIKQWTIWLWYWCWRPLCRCGGSARWESSLWPRWMTTLSRWRRTFRCSSTTCAWMQRWRWWRWWVIIVGSFFFFFFGICASPVAWNTVFTDIYFI